MDGKTRSGPRRDNRVTSGGDSYNIVIVRTRRREVTKQLGALEQMLMFAVARLGEGAHGLAIRREVEGATDRKLSPGAVYTTLDRLARQGYVSSWIGQETPEGGGRRRKFYKVEAKSGAHDRRGRGQHFRHTRTAFRSLVTNDHHIPFLYAPLLQRMQHVLLAIEHPRRTAEPKTLLAGNFGHRATGCQVPLQDLDVTGFFDRIIQRMDDLLPRGQPR